MNMAELRFRLAPLFAAAVLAACGGDSTGPPPPPLSITTTSLPNGIVGVEYSAGVDAEGGDEAYEWTVASGALPPGLELVVEDLVDNDLLVEGEPEEPGNFRFSLRVTSGDGQSVSRDFRIAVSAPVVLAIGNPALPPALEGAPYAIQLRGTGGTGTYTWAITAGALPAGLSFSETGRIEGTPTTTDTVTLTLRVESGTEVVTEDFVLAVIADRPNSFEVTPVPVAPIPEDIQPHVDAAIAKWEAVLTGDLIPITIPTSFFSPTGCGGFGEGINGTTVEDVLVMINIDSIDGPGQVLGRAGPCAIRDSSALTVGGILTLDEQDLLPLVGSETLTHILVHEIGHILGFGSLWDAGGRELLAGDTTSNPRFTGAAAVAEWRALGGEGDVPVEGTGGEGTAGSHWRETSFGSELMTGFSEAPGVFQPLSRVSIGAMEDLGYAVDYSAADSYSLALALLAPGAAAREDLGYDIVLDEPVRVLDRRGTPLRPHRPGGIR